jgi:hypothetical protein
MYKLILHHVYRSGSPFIDVSGHGNHAKGLNVLWDPNGAAAGSGAAVWNGTTSRALVNPHPVWQDLYALRVEALVRFDPIQGTPGHPVRVRRHMIVEGPQSFSVFIGQDRTAVGMIMGLVKDPDADDDLSASDTVTAILPGGSSMDPFDTLTADMPHTLPVPPGYKLDWLVVASSADFAPDGQKRTFEAGRWTRVTFVHSGTSLWLYLDGVLAGVRHDVISPVLPVQGEGVHIGCAPGPYADTLRGRLDELRIWKYDPHHHTKQFFCRPMGLHTEACWRRALARLEALATHRATRTQMLGVLDCMNAALTDLARAVAKGGQPAQDQLRRLGRRYDELWCRGVITGPAMQALTREFTAWLGQAAGDAWATYRRRVAECVEKLRGLDLGPEICGLADCDQDFGLLLGTLNRQLADELVPCRTERYEPCHRRRQPPAPTPPGQGPGGSGQNSDDDGKRPDTSTGYGSNPEKGT